MQSSTKPIKAPARCDAMRSLPLGRPAAWRRSSCITPAGAARGIIAAGDGVRQALRRRLVLRKAPERVAWCGGCT